MFQVFPNPNDGQFNLVSEKEGKFAITDIQGRTLNTLVLGKGEQVIVDNLVSGFYFISDLLNNTWRKVIVEDND